jgi:hypothetical protein
VKVAVVPLEATVPATEPVGEARVKVEVVRVEADMDSLNTAWTVAFVATLDALAAGVVETTVGATFAWATPVPVTGTEAFGVAASLEGTETAALIAAADDGENTTSAVQEAPGARVWEEQRSFWRPKSAALVPPTVRAPRTRFAVPELVTVRALGAEELPTVTFPHAIDAGETATFGAAATAPVPVRGTDAVGVAGSDEATLKLPVFAPEDFGAKETATVQLVPAARVFAAVPHGFVPPLRFREKSVAFERDMFEIEREAVPVLEIVETTGAEVEPTVTVPKASLAGETEIFATGAATPEPARETTPAPAGSFEATESVPGREPVDFGEKVTATVQLAPGARVFAVEPQGFVPPFTFRE